MKPKEAKEKEQFAQRRLEAIIDKYLLPERVNDLVRRDVESLKRRREEKERVKKD